MKKVYYPLFLAFLFIAGCQPQVTVETVNLDTAKASVTQLADTYLKAWNNEDLEVINKITADNGEYYGSDPSELLDKAALMDMCMSLFQDENIEYDYNINVRKVKVADNGKSAIVMEHISMPEFSKVMQMRQTIQMVKKDDNWIIEYISWGFLAQNEVVQTLNKTLE